MLRQWASKRLTQCGDALLNEALPAFEQTLIEATLEQAGGRRQDAARLLGWGHNTLTPQDQGTRHGSGRARRRGCDRIAGRGSCQLGAGLTDLRQTPKRVSSTEG